MTFVLKIDGELGTLELGLDAFVRFHGWSETHALSKLDYATLIIRNFLRNSIQNYTIEQARQQAALIATTQTEQVLDTMTTSLHKEDAEGNIIVDEPVVE